ncbi:hypothetical protein KFE25_004134 [Diacronema lutheri]|uniref:H(+)-exporting diphosphatase n=2 Tax=Diacronema lutheri TaxID=2081491 RepID=A0A8J5X6Y9_DIALT|nr:hypothetical protein KFE25_004134 [Diacronema lutheri]
MAGLLLIALHVAALVRPPHVAARPVARARARVVAAFGVDDEVPRVRFNRQAGAPPQFAPDGAPAADDADAAGAASDEQVQGQHALSVNARLQQRIDASVARLPRSRAKAVSTPVDLNGVQPWAALAGGVLYAAMAYGSWTATVVAAEWFTAHPPPMDVYVATRVAAIVRTVIIGLTSMFAGIATVTSAGMFGLFARVSYGVLTGELDPRAVAEAPSAAEVFDAAESDGVKQALDVLLPREWRRR